MWLKSKILLYWQDRRKHVLADLGRAFRFELVVEHGPDLRRLGIELLGHVP